MPAGRDVNQKGKLPANVMTPGMHRQKGEQTFMPAEEYNFSILPQNTRLLFSSFLIIRVFNESRVEGTVLYDY